MTRTRWKLMAGVLGLSLSGLAVVAGVPTRNGCNRQCQPEAQIATLPVAAAFVRAQPQQPPLELPVPGIAPVIETPPPAKIANPAEFPVIPAVAEKPKPAAAPQLPTPAPVTLPEPTPVIPIETKPVLPQPVPQPAVQPILPQPVQPLPEPVAPLRAEPRIEPTLVQPAPQLRNDPIFASEPAGAEKKLKVILHLGDERPRFEVRDGDEVYLRVLCERVEVKSPSDRGEAMSTLRAAGRVTFVTPGGEGTCDELTLVPGTGQVLVTGKVSFKYNWGKVETTVSGDRMVFRLGTTPSLPQPTTVPASRTR